ncbi:TolC family protein [Psychromonas sp. SP041]|uniref:TolC family protein n=1 Tax=Psychromonas sp. SP041 TaxID=1365007 RepID=UPI00041641FA|nr:TolC family protein [Psychromonas sp. SP041]
MAVKINRWKGISISLLTVLVVSGCSVTPKPWKKGEIKEASQNDFMAINSSEKIEEPISLEDAIYRGINYNRQKRVKMLESALADKQLDLLHYDMLPELTTNAGYSGRDNYAASASTIFEDGRPAALSDDPTYTISQDKRQLSADVTFSWNILDFGLSYVQAQQQSDRYLISKEEERKVIFNIAQEIRKSYYQAITAQALLKRIRPLMKEVRIALQDSDKVKSLRLKSPLDALTYQRELLDVLRDLTSLEKSLIFSKVELAELMGIKPGTNFSLKDKIQDAYDLPTLPFKLSTMEKIALENRPEILEERYKERISQKELSVVMLSMLPGINLSAGYNFNDSDYLLNNNWYSLGANVTWNLFNIFKYGAMSDTADAKIMLAKERKLAVALAVVTQVHLADMRYKQTVGEYKLSKDYLNVSKEIYEQAMNANQLGMNSDLLIIKEKLSYLLATLRHSAAYANMENSYGRVYASMGIINESEVEYETDRPFYEYEENLTVIAEPIRELSSNKAVVIEQLQPLNTSTLSDTSNYSGALIYIEVGETLIINGENYIVQRGDTVSELANDNNETVKEVVTNNPWLTTDNRIRY